MREEKKKKAKEKGDFAAVFATAVVFVPVLGVIGWEVGGKYIHGTTPAQVAAMSLEGTPKQVSKELSATDVDKTSVRAHFRVSAGRPYDYVEFSWKSDSPNMPYSIRLHPEHEHGEEDRGTDVVAALGRRFHAIHDGEWRWGRFDIHANKHDGEIHVDVDPTYRKTPNPLFERQMDAARQVVLEAAFGIPVHTSDADLAELLGTGYKTADVGKIDPQTTIEDAPSLIASRFPGSVHDTSTRWEIAVDHPLLQGVELYWSNQRGGHMNSVRFEVDSAYEASRDPFETCLANQIGPPQPKVTDYAAGKKDYVFSVGTMVLVLGRTDITLSSSSDIDGASLAKIFDAFGSCHEKTENTGARGDGRKK